jgi:YD repeat-containing protein
MPADVTTYTDMLGRQFKTVYADGTYSQNYYNSKGQVYKQVSPGGMINLTEYDALGRVYRNAVDMNRNGVIDANDEITVYAYSYSTRNGKNVSVSTVSRVVGTDSKVLSVSENSVDGLDAWVTVNGLTSHTSVSYNGNGNVQTTATNPDGSSSITTSVYGKTITVQQYNNDNTPGNLVTYTYDEFNRVASITETYGATTVNSTVYSDYNANGQPGTVTVNGRATTYVYDNMGRRTSVTSPGGRSIYYEYYPTGELKKIHGADTYTQVYAYDALGRMSTLTTYKDASTPQITSWVYNNRGFMTGKNYADGNGVAYDYNADGQLTLRTWARGITTAYTYDNAGRQTGIDYSDFTPDVGYTYDWMGNPVTVTDATGTHVFTYDYATAGHPGLASATVPYIFNHKVEYGYDTLGKRTSMQLLNNNSPVVNHQYAYDVQNRLASVGNGTHAAHYTRLDGNGLLSNTVVKTSGGTTLLSTDRAYDAYYRMTSIGSTAGSTTRSYAYTYNDKDQRIKVDINKVGLASNASPRQVASWEYGYDDKGQVISAVAKDSDGLEIPGYGFGYDYDGIGNRKYEKRGIEAMQLNYTSNSVNQYTQIITPGVVPVVGEADETAAVKALRTDEVPVTSGKQSITATRNGKYFSGAFTGIDNTLAAININYNVYAIIDDCA